MYTMRVVLYFAVFVQIYFAGNCTVPPKFSTGIVSQKCLQCMCTIESGGCKPLGCALDGKSDSCGYFQIKALYWKDCGSPGGSLEACAKDIKCASQCVQKYMSRYIFKCGCVHNCQSYARLHNGGPNGCQKSSTLAFWKKMVEHGCTLDS